MGRGHLRLHEGAGGLAAGCRPGTMSAKRDGAACAAADPRCGYQAGGCRAGRALRRSRLWVVGDVCKSGRGLGVTDHMSVGVMLEGWQSARVGQSQVGAIHGGVTWMLCGDWVAGVFWILGCWVYSGVGGGMVQCEQTRHVSAACGDSEHRLCGQLPRC
jgi:hypothetical protein